MAGPAHASTTIGTTAPNDPNNCPPHYEFIQGSVADGGPSYDVPAPGGVITSWSTMAGADVGPGARLKVYRPTSDADTWTVVGESAEKILTPNVLNSMPTRITVQAGDRIAFRAANNGGGPCYFPASTDLGPDYDALQFVSLTPGFDPPSGSSVTFTPGTHKLVNIAAVVEPDADGDGFGDETQDQCPSVAGALNGCPPPPPLTPVAVPPAPEPLIPLSVKARAARTQHVLRQHGIVLTVQPTVASTVTGTATVSIPAAGKVLRFRRATKQVAANTRASLKLKLSKSQLARVRRALGAHRKLIARAVLTTTTVGNKPVVSRLKIRLKR
jgi:hypothetical protein